MLSIPTFPTVTFTPITATTGTITSNGAAIGITADSDELLRTGVIAYTAKVARRANRPVELTIRNPRERIQIAVHPDGFTQMFDADRRVAEVPAGDDRPVRKGLCRQCRRMSFPSYNFCCYCRVDSPLAILNAVHS
jgi:hypothetical protein